MGRGGGEISEMNLKDFLTENLRGVRKRDDGNCLCRVRLDRMSGNE